MLENQITNENAVRIQAKMVAEGANWPTTSTSAKILAERGLFVTPDIFINAGGVVVSYFEWVQDRMAYFWTEEYINRRLEMIMNRAFDEVIKVMEGKKTTMRKAAFMLAIKRVVDVMKVREIYA